MGKSILCVDDDLTWRMLIETGLKEAGYAIEMAENATEAMAQTDGLRPDLVILDLDLDGENGLLLMQFIQQNYPATKVILYTGLEQTADAVTNALKKGAFCYLQKGSLNELVDQVKQALA
jgi:DNA-binding NtrC family response regulator